MTRRNKKKGRLSSLSSLLVGTGASGGVLLALSFIGALIAYSRNRPSSIVGILSIAVMILTGAICGFGISKLRGEGGILISLLASLLLSLILLMIGLIASGGSISLGTVINYLCYIATSVLFAFFGKRRKHKRR